MTPSNNKGSFKSNVQRIAGQGNSTPSGITISSSPNLPNNFVADSSNWQLVSNTVEKATKKPFTRSEYRTSPAENLDMIFTDRVCRYFLNRECSSKHKTPYILDPEHSSLATIFHGVQRCNQGLHLNRIQIDILPNIRYCSHYVNSPIIHSPAECILNGACSKCKDRACGKLDLCAECKSKDSKSKLCETCTETNSAVMKNKNFELCSDCMGNATLCRICLYGDCTEGEKCVYRHCPMRRSKIGQKKEKLWNINYSVVCNKWGNTWCNGMCGFNHLDQCEFERESLALHGYTCDLSKCPNAMSKKHQGLYPKEKSEPISTVVLEKSPVLTERSDGFMNTMLPKKPAPIFTKPSKPKNISRENKEELYYIEDENGELVECVVLCQEVASAKQSINSQKVSRKTQEEPSKLNKPINFDDFSYDFNVDDVVIPEPKINIELVNKLATKSSDQNNNDETKLNKSRMSKRFLKKYQPHVPDISNDSDSDSGDGEDYIPEGTVKNRKDREEKEKDMFVNFNDISVWGNKKEEKPEDVESKGPRKSNGPRKSKEYRKRK